MTPSKEQSGTYTDVTQEVLDLSSKMKQGEVKLAKDFTLADSLSALELLSPKMDPGLRPPGYVSFSDKLKSGTSFIPETFIQLQLILQHWLTLELSWLEGQSLLATIYTCLFTTEGVLNLLRKNSYPILQKMLADSKNPKAQDFLEAVQKEFTKGNETIEHNTKTSEETQLIATAVYLYSLAVAESCEFVNADILSSEVAAEEDFSAYLGSFDFNAFPELKTLEDHNELVVSLLDDLQQTLASKKSENVPENLITLIQFRRDFLNCNIKLHNPDLKGFKASRSLLKSCTEFLNSLEVESHSTLPSELVSQYFDPFLCIHLLGPAPPRTIVLKSFKASIEEFKTILDDSLLALYFLESKSLKAMQEHLWLLSAAKPNILARARIVPALYTSDSFLALGKFDYVDLIIGDMKDFGVRDEVVGSELALTKELGKNLLVRSMYDILKIHCCNRSRFRRGILNILKSFGDITLACQLLDREIFVTRVKDLKSIKSSPPKVEFFDSVTTWIGKWSGELTQEFVLMGFELELYAVDELSHVCWLLDFVFKANQETAQRPKMLRTREVDVQIASITQILKDTNIEPSKATKEEKKKRKGNLKDLEKLNNKRDQILRKMTQITEHKLNIESMHQKLQRDHTTRQISAAILCATLFFRITPCFDCNLSLANLSTGSESAEQKYSARFKDLIRLSEQGALTIAVPKYSVLEEGIKQTALEPELLLESAARKLNEARKLCHQKILDLKLIIAAEESSDGSVRVAKLREEQFRKLMRVAVSMLVLVKQVKTKMDSLKEGEVVKLKVGVDYSIGAIMPLITVDFIE